MAYVAIKKPNKTKYEKSYTYLELRLNIENPLATFIIKEAAKLLISPAEFLKQIVSERQALKKGAK